MPPFAKREIKNSFIKLLTERPISQITVKDIVEDCGVNRNSFYYHFQDIYDLLDWTLQEDARHLVANKINLDNWEESIAALFAYMQSNRLLILNAFHSLERDTLEREVFKLLSPLLHRLFFAQSGFDRLCEADQDFIVSVYGLGIAGLLLRWIGTNMLAPPEPLIRQLYRLADGSLEGIVQRFLATADDKADR